MTTTNDLSKFGFREIEMLRDILDSLVKHGLPDNFSASGIHPTFNLNSGNVFLTNDEYEVAMLNGDTLESSYYCHECGNEGFAEDMRDFDCKCCHEYLDEILR